MISGAAALLEPFSKSAIDRFLYHVGDLLKTDFRIPEGVAEQFVESAARSFREQGEAGIDAVVSCLDITGIRDRWNAALASARSSLLAEWIRPHVNGTALDLLCGEGRVGEALGERGLDVTLVERRGNYPCDRRLHTIPFIPMEDLETLENGTKYGTVLLCTVLHHEDTPERLLGLGAQLAERRLVIVENCIEKGYPAEYHLLMDIFFNRCLNQTVLLSPGSHRPAAEWVRLASAYGDLSLVERKERIPGIPLVHHLIVVELMEAGCNISWH